MTTASGWFEVRVKPDGGDDQAEGITLGRFSLDKQYHDALEAVSKGTMLTAASDANGSAAYVAIERVTGKLLGRTGSFALMHNGTMTHEAQHLVVTVVPGSGTDQLAGLAGTMVITIVDKKHLYQLDYTFATH